MKMSQKVLLLCAGHNDLGLIWSLRRLGYYIIVSGNIAGVFDKMGTNI